MRLCDGANGDHDRRITRPERFSWTSGISAIPPRWDSHSRGEDSVIYIVEVQLPKGVSGNYQESRGGELRKRGRELGCNHTLPYPYFASTAYFNPSMGHPQQSLFDTISHQGFGSHLVPRNSGFATGARIPLYSNSVLREGNDTVEMLKATGEILHFPRPSLRCLG